MNKIDKALATQKLSPPAGFVPDPGPVHADIQRAFACDLLRDGPLRASLRGGWDVRLYLPSLGALRGTKRPWLSIGEQDGGNYTVFVFDFAAPDPAVYRFDHEDFDEASDAPTSWTRLSASLSSFLAALRPEAPRSRAATSVLPQSSVELGFVATQALLATDRLLATSAQRLVIFERRGEAWIIEFDAPLASMPWRAAFDGEAWALTFGNGEALVGRRSETGWGAPELVPLGEQAGCQAIAIGDGLLAVGTDASVEVFALTDRAVSRFATIDVVSRYGSSLALGHGLLLVGHAQGMSAYARTREGFVPVVLPAFKPLYPGHFRSGIDTVAIGEGWLFGASTSDDTHVRAGAITGQARSDSGTIFALRRGPDGAWTEPQTVKLEHSVADERLGTQLAWNDGLLLASTAHRLLDRQRAVGFSPDDAGRLRLSFDGPQVDGRDHEAVVLLGAGTVGLRAPTKQGFSFMPVTAHIVPAPASPAIRTILMPEADRAGVRSSYLGAGLGAGERWAVARDGQATVVIAIPEDRPAHFAARIQHAIEYGARTFWAVAGDDLVFCASGRVNASVGTLLRRGEGWVEGPHLCAPMPREQLDELLVADGDLVAFLTHAGLRAPHTVHVWRLDPDGAATELARQDLGVEVRGLAVDAANRRLAWCSTETGAAAVYALEAGGLTEIGRLAPAAPARCFGQAVALSRGEVVVGSAAGAHVFAQVNGAFSQSHLLKFTRRKYAAADDAVLANDTLLVVTSSTKGAGDLNEGALIAYVRDPKKGWRKLVELPGVMEGIAGCHGHGRAALAGRHVLLGFPWRFGHRGCVEDILTPRAEAVAPIDAGAAARDHHGGRAPISGRGPDTPCAR